MPGLPQALQLAAAFVLVAAITMPLVSRGARAGRVGLWLGLALASGFGLQSVVLVEHSSWAGRLYLVMLAFQPPLLLGTAHALRNVEVRRRHLSAFVWILALIFAVLAGLGDALFAGMRTTAWGVQVALGPLGPVLLAWAAAVLGALILDSLGQLLSARFARERGMAAATVLLVCGFGLGAVDWISLSVSGQQPIGFVASGLSYLVLLALVMRGGPRAVGALLPAGALDAARQPLLLIDATGRIQTINRSAVQFLGSSRRRLLGASITEVLGISATHLDTVSRLQPLGYVEGLRLPASGRRNAPEISLQPLVLHDRAGEVISSLLVMAHGGLRPPDHRDALRDRVTGLPGPALFAALLERELSRREGGTGPTAALVVMTVGDGQRTVTEHGLPIYERLQSAVAERLDGACDWPEDLAQVKSGTYALLLTQAADESELAQIANRIAESCRRPFVIDEQQFSLPALTVVLPDLRVYHSVDEVLVDADVTLAEARRRNDGQPLWARELASQRTEAALSIETAITNDALSLEYEPVMDLRSRELAGLRVHLSWDPGGVERLDTGAVQNLAMRSHLQASLSTWLLRSVATQLQQWQRKQTGRRIALWLPLTASDLAREELPGELQSLLTGMNLDPRDLVIDVDNQALLRTGVRKVLARLGDFGVQLHLVDFSSGSLATVHAPGLRIRSAAVDARLVSAVGHGSPAKHLVNGLALTAHNLGFTLLAEAVSRPAEVVGLAAQKVDLAQGPIFAVPATAERVGRWLVAPGELLKAFQAER